MYGAFRLSRRAQNPDLTESILVISAMQYQGQNFCLLPIEKMSTVNTSWFIIGL